MADKLTLEQKKKWAKTLYTVEGMTVLKLLAETVGVSANTMTKWVADGKWKTRRDNMLLTREEQMVNLLQELVEINEAIKLKAPGKRYADSKEGDVRRKLIKDIKELETKASVAEIIHTGVAFVKFIAITDHEMAKRISILFDSFIKANLK